MDRFRRFDRWLAPPASAEVEERLQALQAQRLKEQLPLLHIVALINLSIIIAIAAREGASPIVLALLCTIPVFSIVRIVRWRRAAADPTPMAGRHLANAMRAVFFGVAVVSALSVWLFTSESLPQPVVAPTSLAFGIFCIAHGMAQLPRAAVYALVVGIGPSAIAMVASGDFLATVIAFSAASVGILQVHFIRTQYAQMLSMLALEHRILAAANTDALTGLANRRAFIAMIEKEIAGAGAGDRFGIAMIDLDGFKPINDTLGHFAGDEFLIALGRRLLSSVDANDVVARLGGDEFVVLIRDATGERQVSRRLDAIANAIGTPETIDGIAVAVSASIGYAAYPDAGGSARTLLQHADAALYRSKAAGKSRITRWSGCAGKEPADDESMRRVA